MKKEKITLDAIKADLLKIAKHQIVNKKDWRLVYIIPITLLAILIGVITENIFIGLLIFSLAAYHIVRYIIEYNEYRKNKLAILSLIERGQISISTETLSHITNDLVYEPHHGGRRVFFSGARRAKIAKAITLYHFNGGSSWRVPTFNKHYEWSQDFYVSSQGLENISIAGDEFFFVSLQAHHDIAYIYPCKNFELDGSLKK